MLNKQDLVCVGVTRDIRERATQLAQSLGSLNNSITNGKGNVAGYIGEEIVRNYLDGERTSDTIHVYNHDLFVRGFKVEVKTKRRTVPPRLDYEVSVAKTSEHQRPDYYVFTSINDDNLWIIGYISREEFYDLAREIKAGEIDRSNNFVCHCDMFNLEHQFLYPIREFKNVLSTSRS